MGHYKSFFLTDWLQYTDLFPGTPVLFRTVPGQNVHPRKQCFTTSTVTFRLRTESLGFYIQLVSGVDETSQWQNVLSLWPGLWKNIPSETFSPCVSCHSTSHTVPCCPCATFYLSFFPCHPFPIVWHFILLSHFQPGVSNTQLLFLPHQTNSLTFNLLTLSL
jgi:hypothetical protein